LKLACPCGNKVEGTKHNNGVWSLRNPRRCNEGLLFLRKINSGSDGNHFADGEGRECREEDWGRRIGIYGGNVMELCSHNG